MIQINTKTNTKLNLLSSLERLKRLEKMLSLVESSDFFDCLADALDIRITEMKQDLYDPSYPFDGSNLSQKIDELNNFRNIACAYARADNPNYP